MDSLTHLILGHTMGGAATGAGAGAAAYWGALVGNSLPDIDVPVGYALRRGWAFHRKYTHTVPGILLLSALATGIISLFFPGDRPVVTFAWTLLGAAVHVGMDCLNTWGARVLWPFSNRAVGYSVLFIIDPYILAIHGLATAASAGFTRAMAAAWATTAAYIGLRLLLRETARRALPGEGRNTLLPVLGGLNRWRYLSETDGAIEWGTATAIPTGRRPSERLEKERHPAVDASRSLPAVASFLGRARLPYARVEQGAHGYTVTWSDLFSRLRGQTFQVTVRLDHDLRELP